MPEHDYHYGSESEQYTFYRLPKVLFTNSRYKSLSDSAKILYGLMLDRMALSMKNGWVDESNRVFIFFTLEDVQEYMGCKHEKAVKLLAELDSGRGIGLIERVKRGQGKPTLIYVKKFTAPATGAPPDNRNPPPPNPGSQGFRDSEVKTSEKQKSALPNMPHSRLPKNRGQDFRKSDTSNTEYINTDLSENNIIKTEYQSIYPSVPPRPPDARSRDAPRPDGMDRMETYREMIMENIEYNILSQRYDRERLDEAVEIMLEAICSKRETIRVAGDEFPREAVKSRLLKLTSQHIEYAFDCIDKNTSKVYNIKSYILTTLYNAPVTIDSYYRAEVAHDLYGS